MNDVRDARSGAERRAEVAKLYLRGNNIVEIAAALGVPASMVSDDLDVFRREWFLVSKQDLNEARMEELAKTLHAEQSLWNEWERSRIKESKTIHIRKSKTNVTTCRRETHYATPQIVSTVLKCISKRCELRGIAKAEPQRPDWNTIAEQCRAMDQTVIVPPGYPWPEKGGDAA